MPFLSLRVVDSPDGRPYGFAIIREGATKLHETSLYGKSEAQDRVAELNHDEALREVWPDANDPDVMALVNDPEFEPLEWTEETVITDMDQLVQLVEAGEVELHPETQQVVSGAEKLETQTEQVLVDPSQPMQRIRKAVETVAEKRLAN